jgi:uncharacterized sulfatase
MMQWPRRLPQPEQVRTPVSTRRIYHTILDAAGVQPDAVSIPNLDVDEAKKLTLLHTVDGRDPEQHTVYSEIYPPLNFVRAIENHQPELIAPYRCLSLRRAVVRGDAQTPTRKLIEVDGEPDELFDLASDPLELQDEMMERPGETAVLRQQLNWMTQKLKIQHEKLAAGGTVEVTDEKIMQQLRGLGYID